MNSLTATELFLLDAVLRMSALTESVWVELGASVELLSVTNIEKMSYYGAMTDNKLIKELQVRHGQQLEVVVKRLTLQDEDVP